MCPSPSGTGCLSSTIPCYATSQQNTKSVYTVSGVGGGGVKYLKHGCRLSLVELIFAGMRFKFRK